MRASLVAAVCLGLTAAACGDGASHSASRPTTPGGTTSTSRSGGTTSTSPSSAPGTSKGARNSFQGSVVSASGAYAGEGGRAEVSLQTHGSGVSRPVTLAFRSLPCRGSPQCVQLDGTLVGGLTARRVGPPDTGRSFSITATGRLTTLGRVSATGAGQGTGFIARGHETLVLTLISRSGRVTLRLVSGTVGGFTSP